MDIKKLVNKATENRLNIIDLIYYGKNGHAGGSLSVIDCLTAIYELDVNFASRNRSKVILSKGHAVPAQYAVLHQYGFITMEEMKTYRQVGSRLEGHPHEISIPEVDATTGLLGQGLSIGVGCAIAKKYLGDTSNVYVIVGDGELHEGQIWEAMMQGAHYSLDNITLIVDYNKLSSSGPVSDVIGLEPLADKFNAFGWVVKNIDGHNMELIIEVLGEKKNKPTVIIANTIKGKGVSFMENNPSWHGGSLSKEQYETAKNEIRSYLNE